MSTPAVSVLMPVYNGGSFLKPALASVFAQTLTDWELILIDDASTDGSWEFMQRLDDPRVRLFRNETNLKHPGALNRAISLARGKWFARMDADDIIHPRRFEMQAAALEREPQVDALGTGVFSVDIDLNLLFVTRPKVGHENIVRWPALGVRMCYGSLMGKAQWWRNWRVDPRALYSTSFDLTFRSYKRSVFQNVAEPLYVYRFIGHTRNYRKMMKAVHCRAMTLLRHGFREGKTPHALLGLATLFPRPLIYAAIFAVGSKRGLVPSRQKEPQPQDLAAYEEALKAARETQLPLKPADAPAPRSISPAGAA